MDIRKEKEEKTFSNTQVISKLFKPKEVKKIHTIETIPVENKNIDIEYNSKKPILIENISKKEICDYENTNGLFTNNNTDMHDLFDHGLWPEHINDDIRQQIIATNPSNFDNI